MSILFKRKMGVKSPNVELTLTPTGFTYDLSTAEVVQFRYRKKNSSDVETIECTITSAPDYEVELELTDAAVDTLGKFECHVKVVLPDAEYRFPDVGFDRFEVTEDF